MKYFVMNKSKALKYFKDLIGQNNHFLITILVGLDGVAEGKAELSPELSPEFSTSWNPKSKSESAKRSRLFVIKATLSWCIDALDTYFVLTNRNPKLIQNIDFQRSMNDAGRSVYKKFDSFREHINLCPLVEAALVELAIAWRNRLVHHFAENNITSKCRAVLEENTEYIYETYRGLLVDQLLENFYKSESVPRFKEITSFVQAIISFTNSVDQKLIETLELGQYCNEVIKEYLTGSEDKKDRIKRLDNIWSKDFDTRKRVLCSILYNNGITAVNELPERNFISEDFISKLSTISFSEAKNVF